MSKTKPTTIYRKLLKDAWSITWERKTLWVFGIFAALISTGGVIDTATTAFQRVKGGGHLMVNLLNSSFVGYELFSQYIFQFEELGSAKVTSIMTFVILVCLGLFICAIISQASLVHGIKSSTHKNPKLVRTHSLPHFSSIFLIDITTKILSTILVVISMIPVFWYFTQTSMYSTWVVYIQLVIFIPLIIFINIISILSIIHIVDANKNAYEGIQVALNIFLKQWVATIEYSVLLFLVVTLAGIGFILCLLLLSIPISLVYSTALISGSAEIFFAFSTIIGILIFGLILTFGGALVTFQYSSWYQFYKRSTHKLHGHKSISKALRLIHK